MIQSGIGCAPFACILLAGTLVPSPLRRQLDIPVLCLPITESKTMLDLWLDALERTDRPCQTVHIVVSSIDDERQIERVLHQRRQRHDASPLSVEVFTDSEEWRGPAGRVRDVVDELDGLPSSVYLVGEASCLPPRLDATLLTMSDCDGVVGASAALEPVGVYAFTGRALEMVPKVGFVDLKEQFLPTLYEHKFRIRSIQLARQTRRIWDRSSYLAAVRALRSDQETSSHRSELGRHVCASSLVHDEATIGNGAIIHESVILPGATVGAGAIVSRSVIGPGSVVKPGMKVRSQVYQSAPNRRRAVGSRPGQRREPETTLIETRLKASGVQ